MMLLMGIVEDESNGILLMNKYRITKIVVYSENW